MSATTNSYLTFPISTDWNDLATAAIQQLQTQFPGWVPEEGSLETWLIYALSVMEANTRDVAAQVPTAIFRYFGQTLMGVLPINGAAAQAPSTWTMRDGAGYTIPAGTLVVFNPTGTAQAYFTVQSDVVVAPGSTETADGEVTLVSTQLGTAYNGYPAQAMSLVDALAFVTDIETTAPTAGGVDAETDSAYLNRLRADLQLLTPRPILANDFAVLALSIAGVGRATAIDNYNPADGTTDNERMVAVAVADSGGRGVTSGVKTAVQTYLESLREVNFVVNVIEPTYTTLNVTASISVTAGNDPDTVTAAVVAAVQNYLAPANWSWSPIVRYNELIALISGVSGVAYVASLSQPSADVTLPGVAALVTAGSVAITAL